MPAILVTDFVLGQGEVGTAIKKVLDEAGCYDTVGYDKVQGVAPTDIHCHADFLHICIPWSNGFELEVEAWKLRVTPGTVVVHSTVPVGTCVRLCAVHSPIVGVHPMLEKSLLTFTKWIGGRPAGADRVADHLRRAGMRVYVTEKATTCELMKLMDTLFYGTCLEFTRQVEQECSDFNVSFEAWSLYTAMYNEGYLRLGRGEFVRPNLTPPSGRLGGHCILPNAHLIRNDFTELLLRRNEEDDGD